MGALRAGLASGQVANRKSRRRVPKEPNYLKIEANRGRAPFVAPWKTDPSIADGFRHDRATQAAA
jgi:hypothetical protein